MHLRLHPVLTRTAHSHSRVNRQVRQPSNSLSLSLALIYRTYTSSTQARAKGHREHDSGRASEAWERERETQGESTGKRMDLDAKSAEGTRKRNPREKSGGAKGERNAKKESTDKYPAISLCAPRREHKHRAAAAAAALPVSREQLPKPRSLSVSLFLSLSLSRARFRPYPTFLPLVTPVSASSFLLLLSFRPFFISLARAHARIYIRVRFLRTFISFSFRLSLLLLLLFPIPSPYSLPRCAFVSVSHFFVS